MTLNVTQGHMQKHLANTDVIPVYRTQLTTLVSLSSVNELELMVLDTSPIKAKMSEVTGDRWPAVSGDSPLRGVECGARRVASGWSCEAAELARTTEVAGGIGAHGGHRRRMRAPVEQPGNLRNRKPGCPRHAHRARRQHVHSRWFAQFYMSLRVNDGRVDAAALPRTPTDFL